MADSRQDAERANETVSTLTRQLLSSLGAAVLMTHQPQPRRRGMTTRTWNMTRDSIQFWTRTNPRKTRPLHHDEADRLG